MLHVDFRLRAWVRREWVIRMGTVEGMTRDNQQTTYEEPKMTAAQLANRVAMSALIEFNMEDASAHQQHALPHNEMKIMSDDGIDPDLLAGDEEFDLMQVEAEGEFFSQLQHTRSSRESRRFFRNW